MVLSPRMMRLRFHPVRGFVDTTRVSGSCGTKTHRSTLDRIEDVGRDAKALEDSEVDDTSALNSLACKTLTHP